MIDKDIYSLLLNDIYQFYCFF